MKTVIHSDKILESIENMNKIYGLKIEISDEEGTKNTMYNFMKKDADKSRNNKYNSHNKAYESTR